MRIGIDYRILGVGPTLISRGMGRFTQQQLREVLRVDSANEYLLLCRLGDDLSLIDSTVRDSENVSIRIFTPLPTPSSTRTHDLLRGTEHFQAWIDRQGVDLYHATTPLHLEDPFLIDFDVCPMVATFYDLIPLLFAPQYLEGNPDRERYMRGLHLLQGATRLLAISGSAREDAIEHLGVDRDRVDLAWPIPDQVFRPLPPHMLDKLLLTMRGRVPEQYVLTVSYPYHCKNLETLLRGYALLGETLRTELPLIVCGPLDAASRSTIEALAEKLHIADDVVLMAFLSDGELCALYNRATVVVHPSLYEGFGLPVLEAMRCGAPVITTTSASLPEVAGEAALLVEACDARAFADAISSLVGDRAARDLLRERGFVQASKFSGQQLAQATLKSYAAAVRGPCSTETTSRPPDRQARLHVAMWTPLPPQQTGIADYSADLLPALQPHCELEVFVDDGVLPAEALLNSLRIHHYSAFERRHACAPFDAIVYQMGGSPYHLYMEPALHAYPGIVVLHDLVWSSVLHLRACIAQDIGLFESELVALEGDAALRELRAVEHDPDLIWDLFRRYPMLDTVIGGSLAQVVHFDAAAEDLRARHPETSPVTVAMGIADPYAAHPGMGTRLARCRLGIDPTAFVVGVMGIVHRVKRIEQCIQALPALVDRHPNALLNVVGRSLDDTVVPELGALAARLGVASRVHFTGHVDRTDFDLYSIACDVVVNLRTPTAKHMSATLMRSLAAGKPVMISDLPDWRFLPDECCARIPLDGGEVPSLVEALCNLADDVERRQRMAAAARSYFLEHGTVDLMASRYLEVIRTAAGKVRSDAAVASLAGTV